ncbi:AsnC family transcriptional regulator [bacterium]|nr:AsnC family transcriptional regulator [bacterium]|tara:strand:+ start:4028 stop:4480 length:453 start_codon:yes stop_codon:yes gene_type:complete
MKKTHLKILSILQTDGKASYAEIGKKVGLSTSSVQKAIKEMERENVIKGYKADINLEKLGFDLIALFLIKANGPHIRRIVKSLKKDRSLEFVYEITGEYDIATMGKFRNRKTMNNKIKELLNDKNIESTNTSIVLSIEKEERNLDFLKEQ